MSIGNEFGPRPVFKQNEFAHSENRKPQIATAKTLHVAADSILNPSQTPHPTPAIHSVRNALGETAESEALRDAYENRCIFFTESALASQVKQATEILESGSDEEFLTQQPIEFREPRTFEEVDQEESEEGLDTDTGEGDESTTSRSSSSSDYELDSENLKAIYDGGTTLDDIPEDDEEAEEVEHIYGPFVNENSPIPLTRKEKENVLLSLAEFRYFTSELHDSILAKDVEDVYAFIMERGGDLLDHAELNGKIVHVQIRDGNQLFATPDGKLYVELKQVGEGTYKTALKVTLIGCPNLEKLREKAAESKVISINKKSSLEQETDTVRVPTKQEAKNERKINVALREQYKKGANLSHVCMGKPIKTIDLNDKKPRKAKHGFLTPFANGGNVEQLLGDPTTHRDVKINVIKDMALALSQLHACDIVHRDLKPDNFLIFRNAAGEIESVKVTDFGKSTYMDEERKLQDKVRLPFPWIAPEWMDIDDSRMSKEGDVYQLGITFYQIFAGLRNNTLPFGLNLVGELIKKARAEPYRKYFFNDFSKEELKMMNEIVKSSSPMELGVVFNNLRASPVKWPRMSKIPLEIRELIYSMLNADPSKRPTADQVSSTLAKIRSA